jgi:hypothetical protein
LNARSLARNGPVALRVSRPYPFCNGKIHVEEHICQIDKPQDSSRIICKAIKLIYCAIFQEAILNQQPLTSPSKLLSPSAKPSNSPFVSNSWPQTRPVKIDMGCQSYVLNLTSLQEFHNQDTTVPRIPFTSNRRKHTDGIQIAQHIFIKAVDLPRQIFKPFANQRRRADECLHTPQFQVPTSSGQSQAPLNDLNDSPVRFCSLSDPNLIKIR